MSWFMFGFGLVLGMYLGILLMSVVFSLKKPLPAALNTRGSLSASESQGGAR